MSPVTSFDGSPQTVSFSSPTVSGGQAPVTTTCTPASGSAFPVGQDTVTCTAADAKARSAVCTFTVVVLPPPQLDVTSFLAFGDSLTWGEDGTAPASSLARHVAVQLTGQTYPDDLQKELQARYVQQLPTVTNAGCPGEMLTTQLEDLTWVPDPTTVDRYLGLIGTKQYGAVLIMEGSNDLNISRDSKVMAPAVGVLQTMVESAKAAGIRPFLATVPPMVPPGVDNRTAGSVFVPTYNDMIKALAGSEGVPLVDVYTAFGTDAPSLIGFDGLHPNVAGYQRVADTFFAAIKITLEPQSIKKAMRHTAKAPEDCPPIS